MWENCKTSYNGSAQAKVYVKRNKTIGHGKELGRRQEKEQLLKRGRKDEKEKPVLCSKYSVKDKELKKSQKKR